MTFFACNAPIKALYDLGVEIQEDSELDLLVAYQAHEGDKRIPAVVEDMKTNWAPAASILTCCRRWPSLN